MTLWACLRGMAYHNWLTSRDLCGSYPVSLRHLSSASVNVSLGQVPLSLCSKSSNGSPFYWVKEHLSNDCEPLHELPTPPPSPFYPQHFSPELLQRSPALLAILPICQVHWWFGALLWPFSLRVLSSFRCLDGLFPKRLILINLFKSAMGSTQLVFRIDAPFPAVFPLTHLHNTPYNLLFIVFTICIYHKI